MSLHLWLRFGLSLLLLGNCLIASAQLGGETVFNFLQLPASSRIAALGDNLISVQDADINLAWENPALLNATIDNQIAFSHNFLVADIGYGTLNYGKYIEKWKLSTHLGIRYMDYGTFQGVDARDIPTADFKAAEYALSLGGAKQMTERWSIGINIQALQSQLEAYTAFGISADIGVLYQDTSSNFSIALVAKHLGTQLQTYQTQQYDLPFDLQIGLSKRLRHLPFRLSLAYHHLDRWNILYDDPNNEETTTIITGLVTEQSNISPWLDNLLRHFVIGGEFLFGKRDNIAFRLGYNHFRKKELSVTNLRSLAGFSFGFGLKTKRFKFDYARSILHLAGGTHHLTIATDIDIFSKKALW